MSLGVDPSSSSPLTTHSRPLPPNRKRNSHTPSLRATRHTTPDRSDVDHPESDLLPSPSVKEQDGTMGGLRERSEEELTKAGRDELEEALRKEWDERENLVQRLEKAQRERTQLEEKQQEILRDMSSLQFRHDEAYNEQSRMEADLEERDELLDRLRKRLSDAERQARESQKRYIEQEQTFEIERQALQAQENHLQQKLKTISSSRRSITPTPPSNDTESILSLKDELASINLSHSTLLAKLNTITKELYELKILNEELQEENEGWEFLIRERTLNGKLIEKGGILSNPDNDMSEPQSPIELNKNGEGNGLNTLDEDLEKEMNELNSDLENQSPIFDDDHHFFVTDLGDSKSNDYLAPPNKHGRRRRNRTPSNSSGVSNSGNGGLDLASELGMADDKSDGASVNCKSDEVAALRAEVKQLKESNKALTLYCSKIIDRIITQEGFEQVLSVDYKTRRAGSRSASSSSRPALKDISSTSWGLTSSPISEEPPKIVEPEPVKAPKARPLSMMVRAMTGPAEKSVPSPIQASNPTIVEAEGKEAKAEKRARRGFSLDFRSLGFGTSSFTAPSESPKPTLRPLTLSSSSSRTSNSGITSTSKSITARKLEIHDEDEEDLKERHRMEANLKLMGINRPILSPSPTPSIKEESGIEEFPTNNNNKLSWISGKRSTSSTSSNKSINGNTPLERLSSIINTNEDPSSSFPKIALDEIQNSEQAILALKLFDEREELKRKQYNKSKNSKDENRYTSPPKISTKRFSSESKNNLDDINDIDEQNRIRTISKSESIKTLWSMGGDSRPGSGEIVIGKK